ncbi:heme exporter protein CcmD [Roseicyclus persicicus]
MPDLGAYAVPVLSAYAVSIALIVVVVGASILKARRVRARLEEVEHRRGRAA